MKDDLGLVTAAISGKALGLGWLAFLTEWKSATAVSMEPHQHAQIELIVCLKGELDYRIAGYGDVRISSENAVLVPARTEHVLQGGVDTPCDRIGLRISGVLPKGTPYALFSPAEYQALYKILSSHVAQAFRLDVSTVKAVRELAVRMPSASLQGLGFIRALCHEVLFRVVDLLSSPPLAPRPQLMDEAVRFLEAHYAERVTSADLVRYMGYGRTRLFSLFKRHTGLTPNEYLVRFRIREAEKLLKRKGVTPVEAAKAVGFSDVSYFRSVFLRYTGRKPSGLPA